MFSLVDQKNPKKSVFPTLAIALGTMISLGGISFLIYVRSTFEARYIPSASMEPTLQVNDRILINKLTYVSSNPKRGDIILLKPTPTLAKENFKFPLVKRIIGLPGEEIKMTQGKVYVNNQPLKEDYITEPAESEFGPVVVPKDAYFVLGDNRNNAYDSRYWGFVPKDYLIGEATRIYWPPERMKSLE
jgi:signal peptidase I